MRDYRQPQADMGAFDPMQKALSLLQFLGGQQDRQMQQQAQQVAMMKDQQAMQQGQQAMQQGQQSFQNQQEMQPLQMQLMQQQLQAGQPEQVQQKNILSALAHTAVGPTGMPDLRFLLDYLRQSGSYNPQVPVQAGPVNPAAAFFQTSQQ